MIYTLIAFVFFFLSIIIWKDRKRGTKFLKYSVILLIFFDGFRWETGTDWEPYYNLFMGDANSHMGSLYSLLNAFVRLFTSNYTVITLLVAMVTYISLYFLYKKYSICPMMSILIYYCSMMCILGSNRQFLAMMICVGSLQFIFERKKWYFYGMILLAASFHITSLVFFPAYFLYGKRIPSKAIMISVLVAFAISLTHVIDRIPFVEYLAMIDSITTGTENLQSHVSEFTDAVSIIGSFKRILFVFIALLVRDRIKNQYFDYFLVLYAVGTIIYLLFNGSVLQLMAGRGSEYYRVYETIVIPFVVLYLPVPNSIRKVVWVGFFLLYFYLMWRDMNSYPVDIYTPYRNVLIG